MVNRFALVAARREPPFHNLGAEGVDYYMDFEIDGRRLRDLVEQAVDDHDDVICPPHARGPRGLTQSDRCPTRPAFLSCWAAAHSSARWDRSLWSTCSCTTGMLLMVPSGN